jgi:hypothetical protein
VDNKTDAANHRLLLLIAEFDRREGWALGGFLSCAHFLNVRTGVGLVAAREKVRVARALEGLPQISAAMSRGELSYSKVRAATRIATPENETDLLAMAKTGPASHLEKVVREYRKVGRAGIEQAQRQQEGRHLRAHYDDGGMLVIEGRLPPEVGAVVLAALEGAEQVLRDSAESPGAPAGRPQPSQLRADALGLLAERALGALGTAERGEPYQVLVHIDAEVLSDPGAEGECCVEHGPGLSGATARRLSCDAPVVSLVEGQDGSVLSVGRKSRRVSKALWRALRARDRTCAWPGCTRRGHLAVHHVRHWADGGETALENLHLCCASHHLLLHEGGFTVEGRAPDGLVFRTPLGFEVRASYEAPDVPEDPVGALRERHAAEGLCIGPRTSQIDWWGQRLDVGLAVDALLREEERGQYEPALSWESGAEGDTGDECTLE